MPSFLLLSAAVPNVNPSRTNIIFVLFSIKCDLKIQYSSLRVYYLSTVVFAFIWGNSETMESILTGLEYRPISSINHCSTGQLQFYEHTVQGFTSQRSTSPVKCWIVIVSVQIPEKAFTACYWVVLSFDWCLL